MSSAESSSYRSPPPDAVPEPPEHGFASLAVIRATAGASRLFLNHTQTVVVHGFDQFLGLLERRRSGQDDRGLLTVSNHKSVLDDPLMWGLLPPALLAPEHMRHALGSADICFTNKPSSWYFSHGLVHPTFRSHIPPHIGGLFQHTFSRLPILLNQGRWVHIFPEGRVHQHPLQQMRYFKWGVSRLILETERAPRVVPIWIEGFEDIMPEHREWPRWLPRLGKNVSMVFGEEVPEDRWEKFRKRWRDLEGKYGKDSEELKTGDEARDLRIETTAAVRSEVEKLRRLRGWPEEEAGAGKAEFYKTPGMRKMSGMLEDGTFVKDT